MRVTREYTCGGFKWLEINEGEWDCTYDPKHGWISINFDYASARDPIGIRWTLSEADITSIPKADRDWVMS